MLTIPPVDQLPISAARQTLTSDALESAVDRVAHDELARGEAQICGSALSCTRRRGETGLTWTEYSDDKGGEDSTPVRGILSRDAHDDVADEERHHREQEDDVARYAGDQVRDDQRCECAFRSARRLRLELENVPHGARGAICAATPRAVCVSRTLRILERQLCSRPCDYSVDSQQHGVE